MNPPHDMTRASYDGLRKRRILFLSVGSFSPYSPRFSTRYSVESGAIARKSQSKIRTAERSELWERVRFPSFTTRLGAFQKSSVFSAPVRLQTNTGRPVSRVRCSHSPFGP